MEPESPCQSAAGKDSRSLRARRLQELEVRVVSKGMHQETAVGYLRAAVLIHTDTELYGNYTTFVRAFVDQWHYYNDAKRSRRVEMPKVISSSDHVLWYVRQICRTPRTTTLLMHRKRGRLLMRQKRVALIFAF